jgi:hypothetical protein
LRKHRTLVGFDNVGVDKARFDQKLNVSPNYLIVMALETKRRAAQPVFICRFDVHEDLANQRNVALHLITHSTLGFFRITLPLSRGGRMPPVKPPRT